MPKITSKSKQVSSPAATGGAGNSFEQHVVAHWLALLLVRGVPPVLRDCTLTEVCFQTEHLGWNTDDFLLVGQTGSGVQRKLLGQVKRTFAVSSSDAECVKSIGDFWKDFQNTAAFNPIADRFALVTLRGTNVILEHFAGLLDCARAARDTADFEHRLSTPGFVHAKVRDYCTEIQTIIGGIESRSLSAGDVWVFLKVLHVLSLDLATATAQTEVVVKTLLAHTGGEADPLGAAELTWLELLREATNALSHAQSYTRDTLPDSVRQRHTPVSAADHRALTALADHSAPVLAGIRSTVGPGVHLERSRLVQSTLDLLESAQVVVLTGVAGGGKSVVAKSAVSALAADHFAFCFRAEEFAQPHLDQSLLQAQVPARATVLAAVLAGQGRKVVLVESVERLLEASTRDAFSDLLNLILRDKSWRLILTCRDYSADLVRTSFLEASGVSHAVVQVPPLDDEELAEVEKAAPLIQRPLASPPLRLLLRNPYVLDMALRMPWPEENPLPANEREFRVRFWQAVLRADHRAAGGLPQRRERAFVEVALRRARALALFAPCGDLDGEALQALQADSMIGSPPHSLVLAAPAHDVLEDWAILRWIQELRDAHAGSIPEFAQALGTFPAIRRTYRKWVSELLEVDRADADELFRAATTDSSLAAQFKDDSLVAILRSPVAPHFLNGHREALFRDDKALLRRVVHLLRVGCVRTPEWLGTTSAVASLFAVPDGPAWACVLRLVHDNLTAFGKGDRLLLLGLLEDWARGVSWQTPYPEGAGSVAAIAYHILPLFGSYSRDEERKRTLKVIAKIPNADRPRFQALLETESTETRDRTGRDLQEIVLGGLDGMAASRDVPEAVVKAARKRFFISRGEETELRLHGGYRNVETAFGINGSMHHEYFPASSFQGPFLQLLRHHPDTGLRFVIELVNETVDLYGNRKLPSEYVETPEQITITFPDGSTRQQWCNDRLWKMYRGTSVGPTLLQSALMAVEFWLFEYVEAYPAALDPILQRLLRQSSSVALTAVVASLAIAHPHAATESLLALLSAHECIILDRQRMVADGSPPSQMSAMFPQLNAEKKIHDDERKQADARPHRRQDLEVAICSLQFGPAAARVQKILDRHQSELPSSGEQDEYDRVWRMALSRMDMRRYRATVEEAEVAKPYESGGGTQQVKRVRFDPLAAEPDLESMVNEAAARHAEMNSRLALQMWGLKAFERADTEKYDPAKWKAWLAVARTAPTNSTVSPERDLGESGPAFVAAVCVRDHWDEMADEERTWCANTVCSEVEGRCDEWHQMARMQRYSMAGDRPAAWAVSALVSRVTAPDARSRVLKALVLAVTHSNDEVRNYAAAGVGVNLWGTERKLATRCANLLASEATQVEEELRKQEKLPYQKRRNVYDIEPEVAASLRGSFFTSDGISNDAYRKCDPATWSGSEAFSRILAILLNAPDEAMSVEAFRMLSETLAGWWTADDQRENRRERPSEIEPALTDLLERFLFRVPPETARSILEPILAALDHHPREVSWIIRGLIGVEDREGKPAQFWFLWGLFAERVAAADWLDHIDDEHPVGSEMMSGIFLNTRWKDNVRHWRSLEGYSDRVHSLFERLPASATIYENYVFFLYHIGEQSLPEAFIRLTNKFEAAEPSKLLRGRNTIFLLETLLRRHVYVRPLELKRRSDLKNAVLRLLDVLVENGSSAAFRMRDDFVTPISAA